MITVDLLTLAKKLDNYALDATGGGLWTSTTTYQALVPTNKRWWVIGGVCFRDVSGTITIRAHNVTDDIIQQFDTQAAATGVSNWPGKVATNAVFSGAWPYPLDAGEYVLVTFGVAQGAGAYATCNVLEVDV